MDLDNVSLHMSHPIHLSIIIWTFLITGLRKDDRSTMSHTAFRSGVIANEVTSQTSSKGVHCASNDLYRLRSNRPSPQFVESTRPSKRRERLEMQCVRVLSLGKGKDVYVLISIPIRYNLVKELILCSQPTSSSKYEYFVRQSIRLRLYDHGIILAV